MTTLHKHYKVLAHLIIEKAKQTKQMSKYDFEHIVRPYCTILKTEPITEAELLNGLKKASISFVKRLAIA